MANNERKKQLEREIEQLRRRLDKLTDRLEEEEEIQLKREKEIPRPPRPARPKPARHPRQPNLKAEDPLDDDFMKDFDPFQSDNSHPSDPGEKINEKVREKVRRERERIREDLQEMRRSLREQAREYKQLQRELREREREIREKEREFRAKGKGFVFDVDRDIEGVTGDLELRLGEYTRSILESVADSLKTSMKMAISGASEIGKGLGSMGIEISEMGKEIQDKIAKEHGAGLTSTIPEEKMEEFYEEGAKIVSSIGDPNRLRLLKELEKEPKYQKELSDITGLRGGTFKHHMDKLMEDEVKFVTQEVVRGRYLLTTRGREALKLAEMLYLRYLEEKEGSLKKQSKKKKGQKKDDKDSSDDNGEFKVKIR